MWRSAESCLLQEDAACKPPSVLEFLFCCVRACALVKLQQSRRRITVVACRLASPAMMEQMCAKCVLNQAAESCPLCVVNMLNTSQVGPLWKRSL